MSELIIDLKKDLLENIAVINFLESQIAAAKKSETSIIHSIKLELIGNIGENLEKIHPQFKNYLSRTIANFRSLNLCYYYKDKQDTDTITIKNYMLSILEFGVSQGRAFITLPAHGLPKKAFIEFFKKHTGSTPLQYLMKNE